jgi:transposase
MRILCDYLCILGFLAKDGGRYSLTQDTATFLDKRSPAYLGGAIEFLLSPMLTDGFKDLTAAIRKGGAVISEEGVVAPEHPIWMKFARAMAPMAAMPSQLMAKLVDEKADRNLKILDIAAGHGLYGIAFAKNNPQAKIVALDWARVGSRERERPQCRGQRSLQYDWRLTGGEAHEVKGYEALMKLHDTTPERLLGDNGYDSDEIRSDLAKRGIEPVIPPRSNRTKPIDYDRKAYKRRNLIERCVNRLKQFRRIATRYEKTARAYLSMLGLAATRLWMKTVNTA